MHQQQQQNWGVHWWANTETKTMSTVFFNKLLNLLHPLVFLLSDILIYKAYFFLKHSMDSGYSYNIFFLAKIKP